MSIEISAFLRTRTLSKGLTAAAERMNSARQKMLVHGCVITHATHDPLFLASECWHSLWGMIRLPPGQPTASVPRPRLVPRLTSRCRSSGRATRRWPRGESRSCPGWPSPPARPPPASGGRRRRPRSRSRPPERRCRCCPSVGPGKLCVV